MSTLILGFTINDLVLAVLYIPLLSGIINGVIAIVSARSGRPRALPVVAALGVGAPFISLIIIGLIIFMLDGAPEGLVVGPYADWLQTGIIAFDVTFWLDPLAFVFALVVSFLVAILSLFTLSESEEAAFSCSLLGLGLFLALTALWAESLPIFFFAWEGMAFLTFLLFLFSASQKGSQLVFWMTRISAGLFLFGIIGVVCLLSESSSEGSELVLSFASLTDHQITINRTLLFFFLIPGFIYTAQFPFSLWLWRSGDCRATELAWIAGAGMPVLGIYLFARIHVLSLASPTTLLIFELLGAGTALIAALLACFQDSIRRVIAYSVVSQAGMVLAAFGIGSVPTGILHWILASLATVLILVATTTMIRAVGGDNFDRLGGYHKEMRFSFIIILLACASLIGVFPLAGFFSRLEIIWHLFSQERYFTWILLTGSSLLTAVYASRLVAKAFLGKRPEAYRAPIQAHLTIKELVPLCVLGVLVVAAVGVAIPEAFYGKALFRQWIMPVFEDHIQIRSEIYGRTMQLTLVLISLACLVITSALTFIVIVRRQSSAVMTKPRLAFLRRLAREECYLDHVIQIFLVRPLHFIADTLLDRFVWEKIQRGLFVDGVAAGLRLTGRGLLKLQTGLVQHYLFWIVLGTAAIIAWVIL